MHTLTQHRVPLTGRMPHSSPRSRRHLLALFLLYLVLLTWVVMWKLEVPQVGHGVRNVKLVPFISSDGDGASEPVEVVGNLLLFVPFGVYLALLAPRWSRLTMVVLAVGTSAAMEVGQYVLAVGRTDTTDVIVNTSGAVVGFALVALAHRGLGAHGLRVLPRACALGTVVAVAACAMFVAGPIRYGPPDVRCDSQGSCRVGHDLAR